MSLLRPLTRSVVAATPHSARGVVGQAVSALLHGSERAKREGEESIQQHSRIVGRGKYVHEFQKHSVKPEHVEEYKELISKYYDGIANDPDLHVRLTGSFEIVVGELDTFVHIWEYEGMPGFSSTKQQVKESKGHLETFNKQILPLLASRTNQLTQEFNFWKSSPPVVNGGIYELRSYVLNPGALLEWEQHWRIGLEARIKSGHAPIGAWFSQIGRLHEVHHMWNYPSLEARRVQREAAWQNDAWCATVSKTVKLATHMDSLILRPLPYSPIR